MADDGEKEVADKEAQTDFTFSSTDTNSAVDFQLRNRGAQPPQDGAETSAPEEVPPEPAEPEPKPEPEPEPEPEVEEGEDEGEAFDVEEAEGLLEGYEDEQPEGEPLAVEETEPVEVEGEKVEGEVVEGEVLEVEEAVEVAEVEKETSEEFQDAVESVEGEEREVKSEILDEGEERPEEGEIEEQNENDKGTQTVFGYHPDDSLTAVIEELRTKRPHDDEEPPEEEVETKPGPPPPVVLKLHLVVETGTERIPLDLELTIDNLGAVMMSPSNEGSQVTGAEEEEKTRESEMQTALSFYDNEQNLTEAPEGVLTEAEAEAEAAAMPPGGVQDVDDYNFLGLLDTASIASDLSRDIYSPDLMTDEDLMVEPDLVPDQYMEVLEPTSDTEVASWYGDDAQFPDVSISRISSMVKVTSTLQVVGPAQIHWGLVLPPSADGKTSNTGSFSGVSMISTIHQLRHENAVSHLDRIDIDNVSSNSTASSFFSVNGEALPVELYAVRTRVIFQIRSTVVEQRSVDGRFTGATPISLHLETPMPAKPSVHVATVELGDDDVSPSHVTFRKDADERKASLLPGGEMEFTVDVDECPMAGGMRLVAQVDGEMLVEPIDVRDGIDRVMRLDNLEVTARLICEPIERKSVLKKDDEKPLKAARVNALTCTLTTGPEGTSYTQEMEPSGSPLQFFLPVAGGPVRATLTVIPQEEPEEPEEPDELEELPEEEVEEAEVEEEVEAVEPEEKDSQGELFIAEMLDEMMEEVGRTAHTPPSHPASVELVDKLPGSGLAPERVGVDGDRCRDRAYEMIVSALEAYEQGIAPLTDALLEISRKAKELGVAAADGEMPYESSTSLVSLHHCPCLDTDYPGGTPPTRGYNAPSGFMQRGGDSRQYQGSGGRRPQRYPRQQDTGAFCYRQESGAGGFRFGHQFYGVDRGSEVWGGSRQGSSDECDLCRPRCSLPPMSPIASRAKAAPSSPKKSGSVLATPAAIEPATAEPASEPVPEPAEEPETEMNVSNLDDGSTISPSVE